LQEFDPGINAADAQYQEGISAFVFVDALPTAGLVTKEPKPESYASE
jgi:hypothetical protein